MMMMKIDQDSKMDKTRLLTIKQAAELLGITPLTLRRWDKSDRLKAIRIGSGKHRRYEESHLLDLIKKGKI